MKRTIALLAVIGAVASIAATAAAAPAAALVAVAKKPVTAGFYRGQTIGYFDFGSIKLKPGNKLAPLWTVTNPAAGQHNIVDTVPGQADYSPLWQINMVTFKTGVTPYVLKSKTDVDAAVAKGDVTVTATKTVVNCPVLGFGQKRVAGFSAGKTIHYYDLGPVKVAPGNAELPLVALSERRRRQHNITEETIAGHRLPAAVAIVMRPSTAHKRLLTSFAAVKQAKTAGELTLHATSLVVNCPLIP